MDRRKSEDIMNKRKILFIILAIIVVIALIVASVGIVKNKDKNKAQEQQTQDVKQELQISNIENYVGELNDGSKISTNANMNQESDLGDLHLSNIRLTLKNGVTTFRAIVTNNGDNKTELKNITLKLFDENNNELVSAKGILNEIESGANQELAISITSNYINANSYKVSE